MKNIWRWPSQYWRVMRMRWNKIARCTSMLPGVTRQLNSYPQRSLQENYAYLQDVSKKVLKRLGYTLHVHGLENAKEASGVLFVSNHQGTMDPALIVASCPVPVSFISKKENEKIPVLGKCAMSIETIHFDRDTREGNVHMLREAMRYLKQGKNLCLFAEGTRSKGDAMHPFKEGSLQVAKMSRATIIPITLNHAYDLDTKGKSYSDLGIHYGKPLEYKTYRTWSEEELRLYVQREVEKNI